LRPESLSTGTPTWEDDEEVYRWRTGDVFDDDCPMLWIHGYWQRPAGIVLNSGEYSQAYKPGIYHDTFKDLWVRERLVFLGFGFNDPQFTFMVGEFLRDLRDANAEPRHVAILGLPVEKDGRLPDAEAIRERRENLEADYHVRALFYPVPDGDHSGLQVLLEHLAERCSSAGLAPAPPPLAPAATPASVLSAKWVHESSNDEKFTGRNDEIARLDRWVRDAAVRVLAVCAVGRHRPRSSAISPRLRLRLGRAGCTLPRRRRSRRPRRPARPRQRLLRHPRPRDVPAQPGRRRGPRRQACPQ
jgi:hypothetical protein